MTAIYVTLFEESMIWAIIYIKCHIDKEAANRWPLCKKIINFDHYMTFVALNLFLF